MMIFAAIALVFGLVMLGMILVDTRNLAPHFGWLDDLISLGLAVGSLATVVVALSRLLA